MRKPLKSTGDISPRESNIATSDCPANAAHQRHADTLNTEQIYPQRALAACACYALATTLPWASLSHLRTFVRISARADPLSNARWGTSNALPFELTRTTTPCASSTLRTSFQERRPESAPILSPNRPSRASASVVPVCSVVETKAPSQGTLRRSRWYWL